MATRRHRLVIKPNIRPVAAKTGGATTPKPKPSSANVAVEPPSPAARTQLATPSVEENSQQSADEEEKKVENLSDADLYQASLKPAVDITDDDVQPGATSGDVESEPKTSSTAKEASGAHKEREVSLSKKEKAFASTNDVSNDDVSGNCPSNLVDTTSISVRPHAGQQSRNPKSSTPDVDNQALKSKDQTDSAEVVKNTEADDDAASPSETDSSSMLETVSLDPDDDRREETGDRSLKNRRWHKTKKTRTEPLPSREKSPDRQKMKMSDLLSWNPQQNFLPKKNKKKAVLKNENHLESPVSSPAEDNDKESTNQSGSLPAPQIMIGPDGNIVLDTESLLIHAPKDDNRPKEVLEDDDDDRYLNTNTYRQYKKPKQWTERETEKFFIGLSMCGTDFSLLTNLLPHRSRRELKNKFHREERRNRDLIDKALSNRQQYDLAPFEKMTAEDEKKMKKEMKKHIKKENRATEKSEKSSRKRGRKRKNKESEDEEDNWGPEYDEENEENQDNEEVSQGAAQATVVKQKQRTPKLKKELDKPKQSEQNASGVFPENPGMPFLPGYCKKSATDGLESIAPEVPQYAGYSDLDNPKMRNKPTKTYSRFATQERANQAHVTPTANMGANFQTSSAIQAIPGSNQVQIEMEGVQNPVQGVLIPSHMVPLIAPQLGIQGNPFGIQVLLVQEETESGSLVHVYVIPEGDTSSASCNSADAGMSRSNSHPAFSSPVQSPHHASSAQSPHQTPPFTVPCSPHPLASAFSPPLHSSVQIRSPVSEPQTADHAQRLHFQAHASPPHQNLHPVPSQGFPGPPSSCSGSNIEIIVTQPPVNTESYIPVGLLENTVAAARETTANNKRKITCGPGSRSAQPQALVTGTTAQTQSAKSLYRSTAAADSVCAQSLHSLESRASFPSVAQNNDLSNARTKEVLDCEMSTANSSRADSDEEDDDCVILDSDKPQSQPDRAALSCT